MAKSDAGNPDVKNQPPGNENVNDEVFRQTTEQQAADSTPSSELAADMDRLKADLDEANDRVLRAHAELENVRRRLRREMDEERRYSDLSLLSDLLPVFDNINRAIEAGEKTQDAGKLLEGVRMVAQQLTRVFEQHHCTRIPAEGQPFDPNVHQAIAQQPSPDQPAGTVSVEAVPGFQLHDRVIRPSQVVVSSGPPEG